MKAYEFSLADQNNKLQKLQYYREKWVVGVSKDTIASYFASAYMLGVLVTIAYKIDTSQVVMQC